jgi:hypothetical protein
VKVDFERLLNEAAVVYLTVSSSSFSVGTEEDLSQDCQTPSPESDLGPPGYEFGVLIILLRHSAIDSIDRMFLAM